MRILGALLAGGQSRRFGSDKALALIDGRPMLDHVADRMRLQCEALVVIGRDWPGIPRIDDRPEPGLGPLGGLAGALGHASAHGYDAVLTSSCDLPALPPDLLAILGPPDALLMAQPTIGLWKPHHADALARYLESGASRSMRAWADRIGARSIAYENDIANINTPGDLTAFRPR
ncbi:molybdenum cofactor guanylyltransferase [Sphingomonas abietis]|uniref:Molybdenum cofactor guanylyltransferase n=1 Tax=Sphingomonas abietis TaxID=3012344 RepID=A0ABY7NRM9_9SPHN|nr:molybdenum cofactor guanylyltransferase [Sphingomonas abietis]WBO24191.1 molybdenum cofactor guanylyltransferase [Sphingomonas abietis]